MSTTEQHLNRDWFHLTYSPDAPAGLPPVIQADRVLRYRDEDGTWLIALWAGTDTQNNAVAACILRVRSEQVHSVTRHDDMAQAAAKFVLGQ